jgi:hypothetical protein
LDQIRRRIALWTGVAERIDIMSKVTSEEPRDTDI